MRRRRRLTAALSLVLGAAVLVVPAATLPVPAAAEPPSVISGDIVDQAGVLTPEETDELRQALATLPAEHDLIREWAGTVERAGDLISQAGTELAQEGEELEQVRALLHSLDRAETAEQERVRLTQRYAAVRDHGRAVPPQAGVEPLPRAAEADLAGASTALAEVRAMRGEHRLRPAHAALEEALARLADAGAWLDRAEDVRAGIPEGATFALGDEDGRMLLAGWNTDEHEEGSDGGART